MNASDAMLRVSRRPQEELSQSRFGHELNCKRVDITFGVFFEDLLKLSLRSGTRANFSQQFCRDDEH